jgi:hypothetical protein
MAGLKVTRLETASMPSKIPRAMLTVSLALIALNGVVFAQPASISGVVSDERDRGMSGVVVTTIPQPGGLARYTTSGSDGAYRFDGLPEGTYRVAFERRGFDVIRRNHVHVRRDAETRVNAALPVRAICRCAAVEPPSPWAQRAGQVIDESGHPLPHARIDLVGRQVMSTDREGRFLIRLSVDELWPLTATVTGFRPVTQQISGSDAASVVLALEYAGTTGVPELERFGGCECPGYLLPFDGP